MQLLLRCEFTGKERDSETGLDFFLTRYYSGPQGRFLSPDPQNAGSSPEDPQSWNAYAYARNNPLLYTDPDGMKYRICDTQGNCIDDYSDKDFNTNLKSIAKKGELIVDGKVIGTYEHLSFDDFSPFQQAFFDQMSAQREATNGLIARKMAESVVAGVGGFVIGKAIDAGVKAYETCQASKSLANISGMFRTAAGGKGNFGIGTATRQEAQAMGEAWVGPGARVASDGKTLVSADGLRVYRPPSFKPNLGKVQANFEAKVVPGGRPVSNGHLDIK